MARPRSCGGGWSWPPTTGAGSGGNSTLARLRLAVADRAIARVVLYTTGQTADFYRRLGFRDTAVLAEQYGPGLDQHAMAAAVDDAFRRRLAAG